MEENGQLIEFIYSDREVLTEESASGERTRYIRGHELVASDSESARTYYHYVSDEQGSITYVLDAEGQVQNRYEYDAFGNLVREEENIPNRMKYCGEMMDAITQQYYLRARYYNPQVARFISEDTYYGDGLNLYAYCHNNPVGWIDPSGNEGICAKKYGELSEKYKNDPKSLTPDEIQQMRDYEAANGKGGNASRPGGYIAGDVDKHGLLSPGENRAVGNHNIKSENQIQSHHPVQDAWAQKWAKRNGLHYDRNEAAAILLPSNSGMSHAKISAAQRARRRLEGFDTSINHEFNMGYKEMIDAGVDPKQAKKAIRRAYKYFDLIGAFDI